MHAIEDDFFHLGQIVLQPTTVCNLNCSYCYLTTRNKNLRMTLALTAKLAADLNSFAFEGCIPLTWHGGEPLAYGAKQFCELLEPLEPLRRCGMIRHCIQTNTTLINTDWCEIFKKYGIQVGVSIDGPAVVNAQRKDWKGNPSFEKIMRGIEQLRSNGIKFSCIAVVTNNSLNHARIIYDFFCGLGCESIGINVEEELGTNAQTLSPDAVRNFWRELFAAWHAKPEIRVREFTHIIHWMGTLIGELEHTTSTTDIFPSIGWNGDVVLLSPEFLGARSSRYSDFVVGNIMQENLRTILKRGTGASYVEEYKQGFEMCRAQCAYFGYCRGGQASNKFFELGMTAGTETAHCRNSQQIPVGVVLENL